MTTQQQPKQPLLVKLNLMAPISGEAFPLSQHSDPAISHALQGQGLIISPLGSRILAPCDGIITQKSATNHQLTIQTNNGVSVELTCGYQALATHGVGFSSNIKVGQKVTAGDALIKLDLLTIKKQLSIFHIALLISNGVVKMQPYYGAVRANEDIILTAIIKPK